jgi:radical SAM superfamily enzyme YgiQ (UPF0313 family)
MIAGLIDVDGHNFPNLALMKISAWHKNRSDHVEWYNPDKDYYDIVYKAKVFTYTPDYPDDLINNANIIIKGGTGYSDGAEIYDDKIQPDYSLYPISKHYDGETAYGFLTRGCIRKCKWCIVPIKEGNIHPYMDIDDVLQGYKKAVLLDNNVLASDHGINQIEKIGKLKIKVDFNQGLDCRLITEDLASLLGKVRWLYPLRLACDSSNMIEPVRKAVELLRKHGATPRRYNVYVLLMDFYDSYNRIQFCKSLNLDAFAQPYRDFTPNQIIPQWQKDMARYTNCKQIYRSIDFKDYEPRKGFKCIEYFKDENLFGN